MSSTKKRTPRKKKPATKADPPTNEAESGMKEVGQVRQETIQTLAALRARAQSLLIEASRLELARQDRLNEARRLEASAQQLMREEAKELGIPEGQAWQMTPEGTALAQA